MRDQVDTVTSMSEHYEVGDLVNFADGDQPVIRAQVVARVLIDGAGGFVALAGGRRVWGLDEEVTDVTPHIRRQLIRLRAGAHDADRGGRHDEAESFRREAARLEELAITMGEDPAPHWLTSIDPRVFGS